MSTETTGDALKSVNILMANILRINGMNHSGGCIRNLNLYQK